VAGPPAFPARLEPDCSGRTLRVKVQDGKKSRTHDFGRALLIVRRGCRHRLRL
jgi:hypothetical protein